MAKLSNYLCEIPSRFFIIVGQYRQHHNATDTPYFKYLSNNFIISWIFESIGEGLCKTAITDAIGEKMKYFNLIEKQADLSNNVHNYLVKNVLHINSVTDPEASIWNHFNTHFTNIKNSIHSNSLSYISMIIFTIFGDYFFKFLFDLVTSYLYIPPARIVEDGVSKIIQYLENIKEHLFDRNKSELLEVIDYELSSKAKNHPIEFIAPNSLTELDNKQTEICYQNFLQDPQPVCLIGEELDV